VNGVKRRKQKMTTTATRGAVLLVCFNFHAVSVARQCVLIVIEWELGAENEVFYAVFARNSCGGLVHLSDVISRFDTWNTRLKILRPNRFPKNASSFYWRALFTANFWWSFPVVCNAGEWSGESIVMDEKVKRNESVCFITAVWSTFKWGDGWLIAFQFSSKSRSPRK